MIFDNLVLLGNERDSMSGMLTGYSAIPQPIGSKSVRPANR
ncbi:hypothetical protein HBNXHr_2789 [Halorhabdus sp. BNX81]|nr:hypothetical protein HBNXHr_2789 [Halorhabdus sp. BNX81]